MTSGGSSVGFDPLYRLIVILLSYGVGVVLFLVLFCEVGSEYCV